MVVAPDEAESTCEADEERDETHGRLVAWYHRHLPIKF